MATCRTCGGQIEVPPGWSVGPAVRKHYWSEHPQHMEGRRADRAAEQLIPALVAERTGAAKIRKAGKKRPEINPSQED